MKQGLIIVKQIANESARYMNADTVGNKEGWGEFTMFPSSNQSHVAGRRRDGSYVTGLENESTDRITELEQLLGADLSPRSTFWETFRVYITFADNNEMRWDITKPSDYIRYRMAIANKIVAPDKESLRDDESYYKKTEFYVHDVEAQEKKETILNEIKDEISSILYKYRNNKDRLLYISAGLGLFVQASMRAESLYNILSKEKEKLTKLTGLERFRDFIKKTPEELQAMFYAKEGIELNFIRLDSETGKYKFLLGNVLVGSTVDQVTGYFANPKNAEHLAMLANEVIEARK